MPSRASASARSFSAWPAWPLTQCQSMSWRSRGCVEALPQIDVLHRLLVGGAPAVPLPAVDPLGDAVAQILRVGVEARPRRAASAPRAPRSRPSAPCGCWSSAARRPRSPLAVAPAQDRAPAARAGIAGAGAVGTDRPRACRPRRSRRGHRPRRCRRARWKRSLAQIFERVLRLHQRAAAGVQPVVEPGEQEAQRRAAASIGSASSSARVERPHAGSRAAAPAPW